jgi:WD40 repeat protein
VVFDPSGELLATAGNDGMVRLWDAQTSEPKGQMIGGASAIPALAFTSGGADLAIANGNIVRFRQVESQRFTLTLHGENSYYSLALAPSGRLLATGDSDNIVTLWELPEGEIRHKLFEYTVGGSPLAGLVWQLAFNPDGSLLASASGDKTARVWGVESGKLLTTLTGHTAAVTSLAFSPDGRWLATGGLDARVLLWRTR